MTTDWQMTIYCVSLEATSDARYTKKKIWSDSTFYFIILLFGDIARLLYRFSIKYGIAIFETSTGQVYLVLNVCILVV